MIGPVGFLHGIIAGNVYDALRPFIRVYRLGYLLGHGVLYTLNREGTASQTVLVPDVSFIRKGRVPADFDLSCPFPAAPDLAVEVISANDTASDVLATIDIYLESGTSQVWVLYPQRHELYQYARSSGKNAVNLYSGKDRVSVEGLFPGLELVVEKFFTMPLLGPTTDH
jgi:Uma2 family endonuclease